MSDEAIVRRPHQSDSNCARLVLLVPRSHVKEVKSALEKHAIFDRHHGIAPDRSHAQRMRIHTTITALPDTSEQASKARTVRLLTELNLTHLSSDIAFSYWTISASISPIAGKNNPLRRALREALQSLPPDTLPSLNLTVDLLVSTIPDSYSVYKPLLLLPSASLNGDWIWLISNHTDDLEPLWNRVAAAFDCTHIALNSPIPASNTSSSAHASDASNILRSPVNLIPICGDFGPIPTPQTLSDPTEKDFKDALWVQTTQNGIRQTWAPLYTMFSRGNVKEKARILHLASVSSTVEQAEGATAVDMYAGIGYFSFSYKKAGFRRLLCWELNPWSVEGLRRGCALNGWTARVFTPADVPAQDAPTSEWEAWRDGVEGAKGVVDGREDFLIFAMSNSHASSILDCLRSHTPPIRHVNLGLLPVSRLSWPSAVRAVDAVRGGWVHAHENVGVVEMDERRTEVEAEFQRLVDECGDVGARREVRLEHVERVKMYAPGVVHAVFDVHIPGIQTDN